MLLLVMSVLLFHIITPRERPKEPVERQIRLLQLTCEKTVNI